ncbi:MAG: hypothetical protein WKF75_14840 [Singulisphaera sp.]
MAEAAALLGFRGKVTGTIWPQKQSPIRLPNGQAGFALPSCVISRNGVPVTTTNAGGTYSFFGVGKATISSNLAAASASSTMLPAELSRQKVGISGPQINELNAMGEAELAQVSVYYWTTVARMFASNVLDPLTPGPGRPR